jgi:hypothetical protein
MGFDLFANVPSAVMDGYKIADSDELDTNNTYYGFYTKGVGFFIMNIVTSGTTKTCRYYVSNDTNAYISSWVGRAGLVYDYFKGV